MNDEINHKVLLAMEHLKNIGVVRFYYELYEVMETERRTVHKIKNNINSFTPIQIKKLCEHYNINANWIFGIEESMFRSSKNRNRKGIELKNITSNTKLIKNTK